MIRKIVTAFALGTFVFVASGLGGSPAFAADPAKTEAPAPDSPKPAKKHHHHHHAKKSAPPKAQPTMPKPEPTTPK